MAGLLYNPTPPPPPPKSYSTYTSLTSQTPPPAKIRNTEGSGL